MSSIPKPLILLILDGWGLAPEGQGNAIASANTTNIDHYWQTSPHTQLQASGEAVGLPHGEVGNTETGHLNIGAGRIVLQDLPRINMSIADGSFFENPAFIKAIDHIKNSHGNLHLLGLIGSGGVHSNIEHVFALIHLCKLHKVTNLVLHVITDGRDSPPTSALTYINQVEACLSREKIGQIASISGRFFSMDRDHRWDRTEKVYKAIVRGDAMFADSPKAAIQQSYQTGKTDEFIEPTLIKNKQGDVTTVKDNDSLLFFNFRIDRPRQLTKAFVLPNFEDAANLTLGFDPYTVKYHKKHELETTKFQAPFQRGNKLKNLFFVTMTEYERGLPVTVAYPPQPIDKPLGDILSKKGLKQLRISETEKERFVTYYFNGLREDRYQGEDLIIIQSPKVDTYDLEPQMSAPEITEALIDQINEGIYDVIIVNLANPDMVAHTGNLRATIDACRVVDGCVGQIVEKSLSVGGVVIITADHGNAEEMILPNTGDVLTEHSQNPVPFIIVGMKSQKKVNISEGVLADIAPTMLKMIKVKKPIEMTGRSLI